MLSWLIVAALVLASCGPAAPGEEKEKPIIAWTEQEGNLLESAAERIENYRKGDATVLVVNADGTLVNKAVVRMEMLKHDFLFGSSLFNAIPWGAFSEAYQDAFVNLFNYATVPTRWVEYEPSQGQERRVEGVIDWVRWASEHGIITRGHVLIFPGSPASVPLWARQFSPEQLDEALHIHITSIVERFRGLIDHWVVMNEPTYVPSFWEPVDDWMLAHTPAGATARALEWARASNPEATLEVNDWHSGWEFHVLLEGVIEVGAQFDAIGIQGIMHKGNWSLTRVWDICERFKDFNVPIYFTEVAVLSGDSTTFYSGLSLPEDRVTTPEGEARQAEYVAALYTILFSHPSVQGITYWDLCDSGAWRGAPVGLLHKDWSPKPAYERLMELIHQEWWTNADSKTNKLGEATIRGFYGQYLLTVESGKKSIQKVVHLSADHENVFEVQLP